MGRRWNGSLERLKNCSAKRRILGLVLRHGGPLAREILNTWAGLEAWRPSCQDDSDVFGHLWIWLNYVTARQGVWFELAGDESNWNVLGDWARVGVGRVVFEGLLFKRGVPFTWSDKVCIFGLRVVYFLRSG